MIIVSIRVFKTKRDYFLAARRQSILKRALRKKMIVKKYLTKLSQDLLSILFVSCFGLVFTAYYSSKLCLSATLITISFSIPERRLKRRAKEMKPRLMLCLLIRGAHALMTSSLLVSPFSLSA